MHPLTARQPKRALIVEDDATIARVIQLTLETPVLGVPGLTNTSCCIHGIWVATWAETLGSAADLLRHNEFDVVILDMVLPDGEKEDAVTIIREAARSVPIVAHSGLSDSALVSKLMYSDLIADYIVKGDVTSPAAWKQRLCHAIDRAHLIQDVKNYQSDITLTVGL